MPKRKVCIVTGSRAEYGLLKRLMQEVKESPELELQLIVTAMHLSPEFGLTYLEIEKDGFVIDKKVEMLLSADTSSSISKSIGLGMIGFSDAFADLKPDIVIVLGDRYEILAASTSSLIARIPIAHLHGGETTEGAFDEAIRHSITKMSHLHFTSTEEYRRRVIQLGEEPNRVFHVGAIGVENIKKIKLLAKKELENKINFQFGNRNLLITYHPVTLEDQSSEAQFRNILSCLDELSNTKLIFTKSNSDADGRIINQMIDEYVNKHSEKSIGFTSMGQMNYLSTLQFVDAVVGNSSSGIIEVPSFEIPTINIGDRQKGRVKSDSVVDCEPDTFSIRNALDYIYSDECLLKVKSSFNPYEKENTTKEILKIIQKNNLNNILKKKFHDIEQNYDSNYRK